MQVAVTVSLDTIIIINSLQDKSIIINIFLSQLSIERLYTTVALLFYNNNFNSLGLSMHC